MFVPNWKIAYDENRQMRSLEDKNQLTEGEEVHVHIFNSLHSPKFMRIEVLEGRVFFPFCSPPPAPQTVPSV